MAQAWATQTCRPWCLAQHTPYWEEALQGAGAGPWHHRRPCFFPKQASLTGRGAPPARHPWQPDLGTLEGHPGAGRATCHPRQCRRCATTCWVCLGGREARNAGGLVLQAQVHGLFVDVKYEVRAPVVAGGGSQECLRGVCMGLWPAHHSLLTLGG